MLRLSILALIVSAGLAPTPAPAQEVAVDGAAPVADAPEAVPEEPEAEPAGLRIVDAAEVTMDEFLWEYRLLVVFADTYADPAFQQQMRLIEAVADELLLRDVVVITDTDPSGRSDPRQTLRPRGFSMVIVEKDGVVVRRNPRPQTGREILHTIDRLPLRRQEMLEQMPSSR
jgi:hypothetical protein